MSTFAQDSDLRGFLRRNSFKAASVCLSSTQNYLFLFLFSARNRIMFDSTEKNEKDNGPSMREETVQIIDGLLIINHFAKWFNSNSERSRKGNDNPLFPSKKANDMLRNNSKWSSMKQLSEQMQAFHSPLKQDLIPRAETNSCDPSQRLAKVHWSSKLVTKAHK